MNIQSCVCVTPWVWRGFYWIQGTLYEIADQTYCQDTVLELCWQHWMWEINQISIWEEDNQQCTLSVKASLMYCICVVAKPNHVILYIQNQSCPRNWEFCCELLESECCNSFEIKKNNFILMMEISIIHHISHWSRCWMIYLSFIISVIGQGAEMML